MQGTTWSIPSEKSEYAGQNKYQTFEFIHDEPYQERPGRSKLDQVVWFVEPNHHHREGYADSESIICPKLRNSAKHYAEREKMESSFTRTNHR